MNHRFLFCFVVGLVSLIFGATHYAQEQSRRKRIDPVRLPIRGAQGLIARVDGVGRVDIFAPAPGGKGGHVLVARFELTIWKADGKAVNHSAFVPRRIRLRTNATEKPGQKHQRRFEVKLGDEQGRGRVTAWTTPAGVVLDYELYLTDAAAVKNVAWAARAAARGPDGPRQVTFRVGKRVFTSARAPAGPRLAEIESVRAFGLDVRASGASASLSVLRETPARAIIQDLRHPQLGQGDDVELLLYPVGAPEQDDGPRPGVNPVTTVSVTSLIKIRKPVRYNFSVIVGEQPYEGAPLLVQVKDFPAECAPFQRIEADLRFLGAYDRPFDPDVVDVGAFITTPQGKRERLYGYYTRDYESRLRAGKDGKLRETLAPAGEPYWRVRYAPRLPGLHLGELLVATQGGLARRPIRFLVKAPDKRASTLPSAGFYRVSKRDPRFFVDARGKTFFPVGMNVAWPGPKGTDYYERMFRQFAQEGLNATRIWLASWWANLDGDRPGRIDLEGAWKIDAVLASARDHGVAVQLCLDNFHDFTENRAKSPFFAPYGPCRSGEDFFRLPEAKDAYVRRLRYLVARYGASPNLLAWELWNEMNYALPREAGVGPFNRVLLEEWNAEMVRRLRKMDPYGHMITTSLGGGEVWPNVSRTLDYTAMHDYIQPPEKIEDPDDFSAARFAQRLQVRGAQATADRLGDPTRPVWLSEFGFAPLAKADADASDFNKQDRAGVHLHNAIWAGSLAGAAAAPQIWWWDNYVQANDLTFHYSALARFLAGEDLVTGGYRVLRADALGGSGEALVTGLYGRRGALLWIQNAEHTWKTRVLDKLSPVPLEDIQLTLTGLDNGDYVVEWWSPYEGKMRTSVPRMVRKHTLMLDVPEFPTDIAVKIRYIPRP